jgi:oxygen-independent coproporphyrinogen-3 oxidase
LKLGAKRQASINHPIATLSQKFPKSLYLHIPFCKRRCFYCDFAITTGGENLKQQYVDVLCQEIALTVAEIPPVETLQTIFFGGGTPSLLSVPQVEQILETIAKYFAIASNAEISLEANAGTVSLESLQGYRSLGINRISLGAQAFQQELLDVCGRGHSVADIYEAVDAIKNAGFENFSFRASPSIDGGLGIFAKGSDRFTTYPSINL